MSHRYKETKVEISLPRNVLAFYTRLSEFFQTPLENLLEEAVAQYARGLWI